jgi:hypothetical protein
VVFYVPFLLHLKSSVEYLYLLNSLALEGNRTPSQILEGSYITIILQALAFLVISSISWWPLRGREALCPGATKQALEGIEPSYTILQIILSTLTMPTCADAPHRPLNGPPHCGLGFMWGVAERPPTEWGAVGPLGTRGPYDRVALRPPAGCVYASRPHPAAYALPFGKLHTFASMPSAPEPPTWCPHRGGPLRGPAHHVHPPTGMRAFERKAPPTPPRSARGGKRAWGNGEHC